LKATRRQSKPTKRRAAGREATRQLYDETQKFFASLKSQDQDPLPNTYSDTLKVTEAWRLVNDAASLARQGGEQFAQTFDKAAAALNQLDQEGSVGAGQLDVLRQTLGQIYQELDQPPAMPDIQITVDEQGAITATNDATRKMQEAARQSKIIIQADVDTSAAEAKIRALQAMAASISVGQQQNWNGAGVSRSLLKEGGR